MPESETTDLASDESRDGAVRTSRLAPSPTGALHLGNVRTFLVNWALARQRGWRLCMRIEDLNIANHRPEMTAETLDVLQWLRIDWDDDVLVQSADLSPYRAALHRLAAKGVIFACELTRREIQDALSAPHAGQHETVYDRSLRPPDAGSPIDASREDTNYRLLVGDDPVIVDDELVGRSSFRLSKEIGDFVVWMKSGLPAYQLAVVIDDLRQGVTDVVRGDDLLPSAARQQMVYRALDAQPPRWWHVPLVLGRDGRRLAKRHGDTRLASIRRSGAPPDRIIGLMARWCGVIDQPVEMSAADFRACFRIDALPMDPVIYSEKDEQWLNQS